MPPWFCARLATTLPPNPWIQKEADIGVEEEVGRRRKKQARRASQSYASDTLAQHSPLHNPSSIPISAFEFRKQEKKWWW